MNVLITGGTGTFGTAFVSHVLRHKLAERVVVFSRDEWKQAEMARAFGADSGPGGRLRFILGDIRDYDKLCRAMRGCDTVIHAAALKRVDSIAYNPDEVLRTNVIGTENVCRAAVTAGVSKVITLSSDKAVHAQNVYGVTKAMGEHITIGANVYGYPSGTRLSCVRYGNVLGSRGSVVHLWRMQVAAKRPITLTHPDMTRFWLTPTAAVEHVLTTRSCMGGGEIFLPKLYAAPLGSLAEAIGGIDYPVEISGLRPGGEKLHERMLSDEEPLRTHDYGDFYLIAPHPCSWTKRGYGAPLVAPDFIYSSEHAERLSRENLISMLQEVA